MNARTNFQQTKMVMAIFLALCSAALLGILLNGLVSQQPDNAAAAGPLALDDVVAILMPAAESSAMTHTVTALFQEPDASSEVNEWLMPGVSIRVLGRSADGAYFAVAGGDLGEAVAGWIKAKDVDAVDTSTHAIAMAKVYRQPDASEDFTNMLTYGQAINVLGTSRDGKFLAVAKNDRDQTLIGWVLKTDLQTEPR